MNNNPYSDQVVLVTGAGRGTGRKLALAFAKQGAIVAANDLTPVNLEPVVNEINATGGRARAYLHDIAKKVDVQVMVNNIQADFGKIDILINCANVLLPTSLLTIDEWDLHRIFEVNSIGSLLVMQSVGRVMRAQGSGTLVNVIKIPADAPAVFTASRAGLIAATASLSAELEQYGLRVFAVTEEDPLPRVLDYCLLR